MNFDILPIRVPERISASRAIEILLEAKSHIDAYYYLCHSVERTKCTENEASDVCLIIESALGANYTLTGYLLDLDEDILTNAPDDALTAARYDLADKIIDQLKELT